MQKQERRKRSSESGQPGGDTTSKLAVPAIERECADVTSETDVGGTKGMDSSKPIKRKKRFVL